MARARGDDFDYLEASKAAEWLHRQYGQQVPSSRAEALCHAVMMGAVIDVADTLREILRELRKIRKGDTAD